MRSIITRVIAAVLTVITTFSLALAYNAVAQRRLVAQLARINQGYVPIVRHLDDLKEELRSFGKVTSNRDPIALRQSLRASMALFPFSARVDLQLNELLVHLDGMSVEELTRPERSFVANVRGVAAALGEENNALATEIESLLDALDETPPRMPPHHETIIDRLSAFEKRVDDLTRVVDNRMDRAVADVRAAEQVILARVVAVSVVAALFAIAVVILIGRSLAPIRALTSMATRLKEGVYDAEPIRAGNDEIGVLAAEFSGMAAAIRDRDAILRKKNEELELAYAALVAAQRAQLQAERLAAVGELSSRVTHELRNPLSSIGLNVEMLADEFPEGTEAGTMLRAIEREVARLTELTERYLSMARSDEPQRDRTDLALLVDDVVHLKQAELHRAEIAVEIAPAPPTIVEADPRQVRQVMFNLLRNAADALDGVSDRRVRLTVHADTPDFVSIDVEDNGPGVAPEMMDRLFEPFATSRDSGTGLGLSISRRIARNHGGDLLADRSPELGGARFRLRLPR